MSTNTPQQLQDGANQLHQPVLLGPVVELLSPQPGESYLDLTAGYGGHAAAIMAISGTPKRTVLVDRDTNAIRELERFRTAGARIVHGDFAQTATELVRAGEQFDMILVDLGVSSPQFDVGERGFSFQLSGPLDMRMDQTMQQTAADLLNRLSEQELTAIIRDYGEESPSRSRTIARAIIANRPLRTTDELATVILRTHRGRWQKIHPATRTFQALRIALNDELGQLQRLLSTTIKLLNPGGRIAIISFHSLEDRLVKRYFAEQSQAGYEAELELLTKKPIRGATNDVHNPRARSAMLRAAVKNKKKGT